MEAQMNLEARIIKPKLGLLELSHQLGRVTQACKVFGYSRDSFYRFKSLCCRMIWMNGCGNIMNPVRTAGSIAMGKLRCRHSWIPSLLQKRNGCSIVATFQVKKKYDGLSDDVATSTFAGG